MKSKLVTPHASIIIWNYVDRDDSSGAALSTHLIEPMIVGSSSVVSISTSKTKSSPAGQFQIQLAPRFNWVTRITPGSWCAILMSQDRLPDMSPDDVGQASENSLKMLGRIDSVRGVVDVDQNTGARRTTFMIAGRDWGSVFESMLYIDPILSNNLLKDDPLSQAYSILGLNMYESYDKAKALPSSAELVKNMIHLWGGGDFGTAVKSAQAQFPPNPIMSKLLIAGSTQFRLPSEVAQFMDVSPNLGLGSNLAKVGKAIQGEAAHNFADLITTYHGPLKNKDTGSTASESKPYSTASESKESFGIPQPHNFFGTHTFWQLLTELSNIALNELVTDIRWENGSPKFALYHRIRPFVNDPLFLKKLAATSFFTEGSTLLQADTVVKQNMSLFKNVKSTKIDIADVVNINFGSNWRDKINFVEITPTSNLLDESQSLEAKKYGQTYDPRGYERDGLKPLIVRTAFLPYSQDGAEPIIRALTHWKFLIREWHFNNHLLLNGGITFIGQNTHIQVGDNILVSSKILGSAPLNAAQQLPLPIKTYMLAHVETIQHTFSVNQETGARSFMTTVQFVRGVITDKSGVPITLRVPPSFSGNALDSNARLVSDERNKETFGTSVFSDPDVQKLGKKGIM